MAVLIVILGVIAAIVATTVILGLLRGWVLTYLWQWFLVPFGLPDISVIHAWGISMLVSFLTYENPYQGDKDETKGKLIGAFIAPFVVLLVGYILQSYM